MTRPKRNHGLTKEVLAVLRSSPNLKPCRKFRKADIFKFVEHLNEGKCEQCLAFIRQLDKEQQMMNFLLGTEHLSAVHGGLRVRCAHAEAADVLWRAVALSAGRKGNHVARCEGLLVPLENLEISERIEPPNGKHTALVLATTPQRH